MLITTAIALVGDGILGASQVMLISESEISPANLLSLVTTTIWLICHLFVFSGSLELIRLRGYQTAWFASVMCCIPCVSPLFLWGFGIGIVSVFLLRQPATKALFSKSDG